VIDSSTALSSRRESPSHRKNSVLPAEAVRRDPEDAVLRELVDYSRRQPALDLSGSQRRYFLQPQPDRPIFGEPWGGDLRDEPRQVVSTRRHPHPRGRAGGAEEAASDRRRREDYFVLNGTSSSTRCGHNLVAEGDLVPVRPQQPTRPRIQGALLIGGRRYGLPVRRPQRLWADRPDPPRRARRGRRSANASEPTRLVKDRRCRGRASGFRVSR